MRNLLQQYFNIAFLMGKPQDLPAGREQMQIGVGLALVSYVMAVAVPFGVERAFLQAFVDLACTGVAIWIALSIVGHTSRFEQAFGGLCGASTFINLAALPLFAMRPDSTDSVMVTSTVADFVLLVWGLSLMAHVIRHTFEVRMFVSVVMSVAFFIVLSAVVASLWPAPVLSTDREKVSSRAMPQELALSLMQEHEQSGAVRGLLGPVERML